MIEPVVIPEARDGDGESHVVGAFPRTAWGHRGYEQEPVDRHVTALRGRLAAREAEVEDLRRELDRLHRYIRQEWQAATPRASDGASPVTGPIALQPLLAQAQEVADARLAEADRRLQESKALADRHLADAEARAMRLKEAAHDEAVTLVEQAERRAAARLETAEIMAEQALSRAWQEAARSRSRAEAAARDAVDGIRRRYQEIVVRAHQRAEAAAEHSLHELETEAEHASDPEHARAQLQLRATYLATSAQISRTAMRAALALAEREFARLLDGEPTLPPGVTVRTVIDVRDDVTPAAETTEDQPRPPS
ncbi:hypothetical protein ACIB24_06195 [Spongisporangium articulatum]|uniref:DivIVA protein n=1 Tax=Spongisporangium articulatum TaxID=3362603 RepID=A0ABW8AJW3_9ACTN